MLQFSFPVVFEIDRHIFLERVKESKRLFKVQERRKRYHDVFCLSCIRSDLLSILLHFKHVFRNIDSPYE